MDLGIMGRKAIVCASSKGLGLACARALAREGVQVVMNGRDPEALNAAAERLRAETPAARVEVVAGDVADPGVRAALLQACPAPDILINNAGGPPPGDFRDWSRDDWIAALDRNMLCSIELIRLSIDGMTARGFGRIINITSAAVRVPAPAIGLSNGARAGLTGFVLGLAPTISAQGVTINNLLPGPFMTDRLRQAAKIAPELATNAVAGRVGEPDELGALCAFLCSTHAGYITGQNIQLDGGLYPGNF